MTRLRHHPEGETLMGFAAGTLDPAFGLVLSCHLQFCARCRHGLRCAEDIGGLLLEGFAPAGEDSAFFERMMQRFAQESAQNTGRDEPESSLDAGTEFLMPAPLARWTGLRRETIPWIIAAPGLSRFEIPPPPGAKAAASIIHLEPGAVLAPERHGGQVMLVLWGSYDYAGQHFARGDLHDIAANGYRAVNAISREGVTFLTAVSPVAQFEIYRTAH
jgi:putative transcriptional regulator